MNGARKTGMGAVVVTGCTSGIGRALAEQLAGTGYLLIGVGRDPARCAETEAQLRSLHPSCLGEVLCGNLATTGEVRYLAEGIKQALEAHDQPSLRALVNNAGTFSNYYVTTAEGFEMQFAVNQLAPFLLTHLLMPALRRDSAGRVVTISSGTHHSAQLAWDDLQLARRYRGLAAYASTKLMNILFTLELSRRLNGAPAPRAYAADPGLVATDMGFKGTGPLVKLVWAWRKRQGRSPERAAAGLAQLVMRNLAELPEMYYADGVPTRPSDAAQDGAAARRLWGELERMAGVNSEDYC